MIHKNRGNRRKQDWKKAERKKKICISLTGTSRYEHDGMYRKGDAVCNCPRCRHGKTNKQGYKHRPGNWSCPGGKNWTPSDRRKIIAGKQAMMEFSMI